MTMRYNWKGRQNVDVIVEQNSAQNLVELPNDKSNKFDESNPLILPSEKRKTKVISNQKNSQKFLSKKKRKNLEQIVNKRDKKDKRAALIESLSQVKAPQDLLNKLTSIATVQTLGLRRFKQQNDQDTQHVQEEKDQLVQGKDLPQNKKPLVQTLTKKEYKRRRALLKQKMAPPHKIGPNYVGFENYSTDSDENESDENVEMTIENGKRKLNELSDCPEDTIKRKKIENEEVQIQKENEENQIQTENGEYQNKILKKAKAIIFEEENIKDEKKIIKKKKLKNSNAIAPEVEVNVVEKKVKKKILKNTKTTTPEVEDDNKLKKKIIKKKKLQNEEGNKSEKKKIKKKKLQIDKVIAPEEGNVEDENKEKVETIIAETQNVTIAPITLSRPAEVIISRACLPIIAEEQAIIEAIFENQVVVICGDTGSGKTTQLPQFLLEKGVDRCIAITQPRRVAATAMACRVAYETGLGCPIVAHSIRYESTATPQSKVIFMTDGVLFKEIQRDRFLKRFSVVIIDEAHERTLFTDALLGLLSRLVRLRSKNGDPLRLVVMSATLRVEDFVENANLFQPRPPVMNIDARQYEVAVHWTRITHENYKQEAYKKVCKIHTQLPDGAILVFLTGQREIDQLVEQLRNTFPYIESKDSKSKTDKKNEMKKKTKSGETSSVQANEDDAQHEEELLANVLRLKRRKREYLNDRQKKPKNIIEKKSSALPEIKLDAYSDWDQDKYEEDYNDDLLDGEDEEELSPLMYKNFEKPLYVLPLYSILPSHKQNLVFQSPPEGCRLCVVATNVAETSLTIPGVKYVVDSGRCKEPVWDTRTGASAMKITWASQASAEQRRGRAGRTGPGHCYRLYSSAVYTDVMPKYASPEAIRRPIEHLVLQIKSLGITRIENFPFPTPIPKENLQEAEHRLILLGAIERFEVEGKKNIPFSKITPVGRTMASLPVSPGHARLLAMAGQVGRRFTELAICLVASLSINQLFTDDVSEAQKAWGGNPNVQLALLGDPLISLMALLSAEKTVYQNNNLNQFCAQYHIRMAALKEARLLRRQLTKEIDKLAPKLELRIDPELAGPNQGESMQLRQLLLIALPDRIACRNFSSSNTKSYSYLCTEMEQEVLLHGSCLLRERKPPPAWIVYHELFETKALPSEGALNPKAKMYIRGVTAIEGEWVAKYVPSLCHLSEPKEDPRWDATSGVVKATVSGTIGRAAHSLPISEITLPSGSLNRYKWFARFFLEGLVCPQLEKFQSFLVNTPAVITKPWSGLLPRWELFFKTLVSKEVDCLEKLEETWKKDKKYLLQDYLLWLPDEKHSEVSEMWPPLKNDD